MSVTPTLEKLRQEDGKFEVILTTYYEPVYSPPLYKTKQKRLVRTFSVLGM